MAIRAQFKWGALAEICSMWSQLSFVEFSRQILFRLWGTAEQLGEGTASLGNPDFLQSSQRMKRPSRWFRPSVREHAEAKLSQSDLGLNVLQCVTLCDSLCPIMSHVLNLGGWPLLMCESMFSKLFFIFLPIRWNHQRLNRLNRICCHPRWSNHEPEAHLTSCLAARKMELWLKVIGT